MTNVRVVLADEGAVPARCQSDNSNGRVLRDVVVERLDGIDIVLALLDYGVARAHADGLDVLDVG